MFFYQVCNRKFKKQSDRDRHLVVHSVRSGTAIAGSAENTDCLPQDLGMLFSCELCDYVSARRQYLERHYRRWHTVVYVCCECKKRFASTTLLFQHPCAVVSLSLWSCSEGYFRTVVECHVKVITYSNKCYNNNNIKNNTNNRSDTLQHGPIAVEQGHLVC